VPNRLETFVSSSIRAPRGAASGETARQCGPGPRPATVDR
jgi:hypothetical protein